MRRRWHIALALAALLVTSGCTLPGADLTAEASPATVDNGTLDETGYVLEQRTEIALNETIGIRGEDREVGVRNPLVAYEHADRAGRFVVFSTPNPETDGAPANPFANRSERRDVARMFGSLNNTTALDVVDRQEVTALGQSTEFVTYETVNRTATGTTPVLVHVAVIDHQGDAVIAVGVHPRSTDESEAMRRLVSNVEHGEST